MSQLKGHTAKNLSSHTASNVHFANFIPSGIPRFWTHLVVSTRHFARDYSLPLVMTAAVVLMVGLVLLARISQRATLAGLLLGVAENGQNYGYLLSQDKTSQPVRNDTTEQNSSTSPTTTSAQAGSAASFAPKAGNSSTSTNNGGGGTPISFSATIAYFRQDSVTLECLANIHNKGTCSKKYTFSGGINVQGGPGTVSYSWRSNLTSANENSSFMAGSGTSLTALQKQITLACNNNGNYTLQLIISSPSQVQSPTLNIAHNCNDI